MIPMFRREVIEREQRLAILRQAFDRLGIFRPVFFSEDVDRRLRSRAVRRKPDLAQVLLYAGLHGESDLFQHVRRLVHR